MAYQIAIAAAKKQIAEYKRAALAAPIQGPNNSIKVAPIQYGKGAPREMSRPAKCGTIQSRELPRNKVHIPPKPIASSFFQGSRKKRPENP